MTRFAFLIGCENYTNFNTIAFCEADVGLIQETLVEYCDYEYKNIERSFQFKGCDDTPEIIYEKLQNLIDKAEDGDSILFYFSGHGVKEGEKGYLLLSDSEASDFPHTALDLAKINELLRNPKIDSFLILDSCHSGILARNAFDSSIVDVISDTGCVTLASCSENEESYPYMEKEQGVFTYFLCEEIKKATVETEILIEDLKVKVCKGVEEWTKNNFRCQTPTLLGQIVGNKALGFRTKKCYEIVIDEKFEVTLKKFEENFFYRCYLVNLELGLYDEDAIWDNYTLAQEICWELELSHYQLIDGWQDSLLKLQFYSSRVDENKDIDIPESEKREVLEQINSFIDSIPTKFSHKVEEEGESKIKGLSSMQKIQNNMMNTLSDFATRINEVIDGTEEKIGNNVK